MRCSLVSNKIIQARERLGLTQQQLAEKLCVTNKAVSKWECGVHFLTSRFWCRYAVFWV